MTIQVECPCGRLLRVGETVLGKRVRCPHCGSIVSIPERPTATPDGSSLKAEVDPYNAAVTTPSEPMKIRTPVWLLYFGVLTAASILWGTLATWKLQHRTAEMEEARKRAEDAVSAAKAVTDRAERIREDAVSAAKAVTDRAEEIRKEATSQAESVRQEREAIMRQVEVTKLREEGQLQKIYPNLRKIAPGENSVNEQYLESFWLSSGSIRLKLTNRTKTSMKPDFSIRLIDKNGMETGLVHVSWLLTSVEPGETRFDEQACGSTFGPPAYYILEFK